MSKISGLIIITLILSISYIKTQDVEEDEIIVEQNEKILQEEKEIAELQKELSIIKGIPISNQPQQVQSDPQLIVVSPLRRRGTTQSVSTVGPCGVIEKSDANTLIRVGDKINTIWEVLTPTANGNCTVSISAGLDLDFKKLRPLDNVYNDDLSFSCGRKNGFEFKQFELPKDYSCDKCTFQLKWKTEKSEYFHCSDLMIISSEMNNCLAKCLNGGACINGKCVCSKNFDGEFCENNTTEGSSWAWIVLVILILLAVGVAIFIYIRNKSDDPSWVKEKETERIKENFIEKDRKEIDVTGK